MLLQDRYSWRVNRRAVPRVVHVERPPRLVASFDWRYLDWFPGHEPDIRLGADNYESRPILAC
jgi:hypothetical protein